MRNSGDILALQMFQGRDDMDVYWMLLARVDQKRST